MRYSASTLSPSLVAPLPVRLAGRFTLARWMALGLALMGELLGLTIRFDTASLDGATGWWTNWLSQAALLPEILIALAAALLVVGTGRLREIAGLLARESAAHARWWLYFIGHLAAFAGLVLATSYVFEGGRRSASASEFGVAVWAGLAAATLGLWLASLAPAGCWSRLVRREYAALAAGCGVGLAAWGAGRATQKLWRPLGDGTFYIVERLLGLIYSEADIVSYPEDRMLGARSFVVTIAPDCSGYEGIGLVAVFLVAFLWIFRSNLRFPQVLLLLPVGIAGIWLANSLRIAALIVLGSSWSHDVAVGGFHSQAGWLAFNAIALGLVAGALRVRFFSHSATQAIPAARAINTPAYLVPFLVTVGTTMIAAAFQPAGFDRLYGLKVLAAGLALWHFRGIYRKLEWSWSWPAVVAGIFVFALWVGIDLATGRSRASTLPDDLSELSTGWAAAWLVLRVVGSTLTVPLVEELAFRGYLMRRMASAEFEDVKFERCTWAAVIASSALFGLMHGRWLAGTLAGVVYALVARRRGKLCDAVLAHAVTNAAIAAAVLWQRAWWLW
ncbi:MAG TPA: exosortase E/protease, VPEID-CTERM system [Planctomycetaceae bacterium]|nr:exosortase E/protease, VPEID-CTERM system [Planctomycetaceae bacterium]